MSVNRNKIEELARNDTVLHAVLKMHRCEAITYEEAIEIAVIQLACDKRTLNDTLLSLHAQSKFFLTNTPKDDLP